MADLILEPSNLITLSATFCIACTTMVRERRLCSAKSRCDLTQQFLRANIHGAARREHLALVSGNSLATHVAELSVSELVFH